MNIITMSVWVLNTQRLENTHTPSVPQAPTKRLSVRCFYQPNQEISLPSQWLLSQNLQKKGKSKKLADQGLRFADHSYQGLHAWRITHNK